MIVKGKNGKGHDTRDVATVLILSWLFMLDGAWCEDVPSFKTKFPINNIAVSKNHVFIAAGNYLYQLNTSLQTVVVEVEGRWNVSLKCPGHQGSPTPENKLLVVSQEAGLVYTGGIWGDYEIEKRTLSNIAQIVDNQTKAELCIPGVPSHGLVFNYTQGRIYIAIATNETIKIYNHKLFVPESSTLTIQKEGTFHSVDAFKLDSFIYMPYTSNSSCGPTMLITKWEEEFKACGEVLLQCGGANAMRNLVSSAFIKRHDTEAVWAGIFTVDNPGNSAEDTALCIFSVKKMEGLVNSTKCDNPDKLFSRKDIPVQTPILRPSTLTHGNLSSVHGIVIGKHIVIFMGTGNGQLLKVTLDGNMTAGCPEVLYEIKEETPVLPRLAIDPLDRRYIYLPTTYSVKRVKVANCDQYKSCSQCLMAADPYCGWCHSDARCTFEEECASGSISQYWVSLLEGAGRCLQIQFRRNLTNKMAGFTKLPENKYCRVKNTTNKKIICENSDPCPPDWPCHRLNEHIFNVPKPAKIRGSKRVPSAVKTAKKSDIIIEIVLNNRTVSERFPFSSCSQTHSRCSPCVLSGCIWCKAESSCKSPYTPCSPQDIAADQSACSLVDTEPSALLPANATGSQITSIEPKRVSSEGKLRVTIIGQNLTEQTKLVLLGTSTCRPLDVKVLRKLNDSHLEVSLPPDRKETKTFCVDLDGKNCRREKSIQYIALPSCSHISPNKTWLSGGRKLTVVGRNLDVIDNLTVSHARISSLNQTLRCSGNESRCHLLSPSLGAESLKQKLSLKLKIEGNAVDCGALEYLADPKFTSYSADYNVDTELRLVIEKENDDLDIEVKDLEIVVTYINTSRPCPIQNITQNIRNSVIHCKLSKDVKDNPKITKVTVTMGNFMTAIEPTPSATQFHMLSFLVIIPLLLIIIVAAIFITRRKEREFSRKLSQQIELLEYDMRNQIRSGFAELQIDQSDVVDTTGTIPFLDYKHFAIRTFFPESTSPNSTLVEDLCNTVPPPFQSPGANRNDESLTLLRALICNKPFLVTLIHTLEKKKEFTIKDRCRFASFLTIALQSKLVYLTHILEVLIRDLMEQSGNAQPKLMLRRTESVVEKLLTNWMSTCLYGFLRETVGEPLYVLVTTLNQRIHKGPVDAITCKALYTLNEDWILWQVTEFSTLTIHVVFPGLSGSESGEDLGQTISVKVLDCDSIGQAKEKFFQAFLSKNNYAYGLTVCETTLELHVGEDLKELKDVDKSSVTLEHGKTKLNTVMHYQIADGSTVTVIKKNSTCTSDGDYTDDYCHLILPDSEAGDDLPGKHHKDKQKFKVKEMYLTKLISTKVAIDPAVETLFSSILSLPGNRVPVAIKFFFDFLGTLYDSKKINDPDIPHIWKTNSLPLRFWVNILKNPQFVFDIKQTAHIDSCLSVIAQAFIDSFSLSEQMLGKDSPTNKLLYAKDMARYKRKVKEYYAGIQSSPSLPSAELEEFLNQESKKHENEFKENAALLELYKYIASYYDDILCKLEKEPDLQDATKQLIRMKSLFEDKKKCTWE